MKPVEAPDIALRSGTIDWLLGGDPAIRWQVLRDLAGAPEQRWRSEQARVATDGWGARLLDRRDRSGRWTPRLYGQKWVSTTYTMVLLRQLGLPGDDARARESCRLFLDEGLWRDGGINVSATRRRGETCVTGMVIGLLSWFGITDDRRERLAGYLLGEQLPDGGWNCRRDQGATHSSLHTTINVLEGLRDYADRGGPRAAETLEAEARGREFVMAHRLYRSHRTGAVIDPKMLRLTFPPRWRYDVLRGLDYFRAAEAPTTTGWRTRSTLFCPNATVPAGGGWRRRMPARSGSILSNPASRAAGTRCVPCACSAGGHPLQGVEQVALGVGEIADPADAGNLGAVADLRAARGDHSPLGLGDVHYLNGAHPGPGRSVGALSGVATG